MVISSLQKKHFERRRSGLVSPPSFVQLWLLPRLKDFKAKHPDVSLRIEESSRDHAGPLEEDIDVSRASATANGQASHAWRFVTEEVLPVCSPDYLKDHGPIREPADLLQHTLLIFEERHRLRLGWREWLERHSVPAARLKQDFVFTDALGSIEAAVLGQGIALGWKHLVHDHVRAGRLVFPLAESYRSGQAIHIIMPVQRAPKRGTELFRNWLIEQNVDADMLRVGKE